jgi:hypothetical protein
MPAKACGAPRPTRGDGRLRLDIMGITSLPAETPR